MHNPFLYVKFLSEHANFYEKKMKITKKITLLGKKMFKFCVNVAPSAL